MLSFGNALEAGASLEAVAPYRADELPQIEPRLVREDIAMQARLLGCDARHTDTAIVIGSSGGLVPELVGELFPDLERMLVLEPDRRMLSALEAHTALQPPDPRRHPQPDSYFVEDVSDARGEYHQALYRNLLTFMMEHGALPSRTFVYTDLAAVRLTPAPVGSVTRTVRDLCLGYSDHMLRQPQADALPPELCMAWADYLFGFGDTYHALKFYLFAACMDVREALASGIAAALDLDCPEIAQILQRELDRQQSSTPRAEIVRALKHKRQRRAQQRLRNLKMLERRHRALFNRMLDVDDEDVIALRLPDVPWQLAARDGQFVAERAPYQMLVRLEARGLRELNPVPDLCSVPHYIHSAKQPSGAHLGLGSIVDYGTLLNLVRNPWRCAIPDWQQCVYASESDGSALHALLGSIDLRNDLDQERVQLFAGVGAAAEMLDFFSLHPERATPGIQLNLPRFVTSSLRSLAQVRNEEAKEAVQKLQERYTADYPAQVLEALANPDARPLRVFIYTSRHSTVLHHYAQDLALGFRELGCECFISQEKDLLETRRVGNVANELLEFRPDLAVLLDTTRPQLGALLPEGLPVVCWAVDELPKLKDQGMIARLGPLDFTYAVGPTVASLFESLGYPHAKCMGFGVNLSRYRPRAANNPHNRVAYLTTLSQPTPPPYASNALEPLRECLDYAHRGPLSMGQMAPLLEELIEEQGWQLTSEQRRDLAYRAMFITRYEDRVKTADVLREARVELAIYGKGWEALPRFARFHRGWVEPGPALAQVYRENKIVLHVNFCFNSHARVFEAFCAGGFVLARAEANDEAPGYVADHLELDTELHRFRNPHELCALVQRAFSDEPWRQRTMRAARVRIALDHTYARRLGELLDDVHEQLAAYCQARMVRGPGRRESIPSESGVFARKAVVLGDAQPEASAEQEQDLAPAKSA